MTTVNYQILRHRYLIGDVNIKSLNTHIIINVNELKRKQ